MAFSARTRGLFDPTIAPLVDLWHYRGAGSPPAAERIRWALSLIGYHDLELDAAQGTARLARAGQAIDLGGMGKGYVSDRLMAVCGQYGVTSAFSNIGGNVSTLGARPDGAPWRVGIRHPRQEGLIGAVAVSGQAVVTSGDYERYFFDQEGRRWHHLLDPRTGCPAESGLISVTVVAESALMSDALSTAMFVAGPEEGLTLLADYPPAMAVLVDRALRVYVSGDLRRRFQAAAGITAIYV